MFLKRIPFILPVFFPGLIWRVATPKKEIFLTFDDGPVPGVTEKVLEILARYKAPAVFFCLGSRLGLHPELGKKILADGHKLGNHSWSHPDAWKVTDKEFLSDVTLADHAIRIATGCEAEFFRPPYGRMTRKIMNNLKGRHKVIMWDVMPGDFDPARSSKKCLDTAIKKSRPGSIVVFHDSEKAGEKLLELLPQYLENLTAKGYSFSLLS